MPRTCSGAELLAAHFDVQEVTREVVAGIRDVVVDLLGEVVAHGLEQRPAHLGRQVDEVEHQVDEVAERLFVLGRESRASCAMTPGGMNWAYSRPAVDELVTRQSGRGACCTARESGAPAR